MVSLTTISHLFLFRYHNYLLDLFRPNLEGATSQRCIIYPEKYRSKLIKKYIAHLFIDIIHYTENMKHKYYKG